MTIDRPTEIPNSVVPQLDVVLDSSLQILLQSFGVSAALVPTPRGVILQGVSTSYYGKQMAQELLRKSHFVVVSNQIRVDRFHIGDGRVAAGN